MAKVKVEDPFAAAPSDVQQSNNTTITQSSPPSSSSTRMKRISVDIDESSHRALKATAAERGVTIAEVVRQLVVDWTHRAQA